MRKHSNGQLADKDLTYVCLQYNDLQLRKLSEKDDNLFTNASITLPLQQFTQLPGMPARLHQSFKQSQREVTLAQTEETADEAISKKQYQTMRFQPGVVSLENPQNNSTVLDTGASFSLVSQSFTGKIGLQDLLSDKPMSYVTADGSPAKSAQALKGATLQIGDCPFK